MEWLSSSCSERTSIEDVQCLEDVTSPKNGRSVELSNRLRKSLYYGCYSDASLPSWPVTDVAVEVINNVVTSRTRPLDRNYATRVARRAKISPCTLMMGILYAERLRAKNPASAMKMSSSDLFLISVMLASKYLYDEGEDEEVFNAEWAKSGLRSTSEVNKLEMEFLASIDWNLFISNQEFLSFVNKVETRVAVTNGLGRGWFSYLDLHTLLDNAAFQQTLKSIGQETIKVILWCAISYLAGLALLLGVSATVHHHQTRCIQWQISTAGLVNQSMCDSSECKFMFTRPHLQAYPTGLDKPVFTRRKRQPLMETNLARANNSDVSDDGFRSCKPTVTSSPLKDKSAFLFDDFHSSIIQNSFEDTARMYVGKRDEHSFERFKILTLPKNRSLNFSSFGCCRKKLDSRVTPFDFSPSFRYSMVLL